MTRLFVLLTILAGLAIGVTILHRSVIRRPGPQSRKNLARLLAAVMTALIVGVLLVLTVYLVPQLIDSSVPSD